MLPAFVLLSLLLYLPTIKLGQNRTYASDLKINLILLMLGWVVFNFILGLLLLFDTLEASPEDAFQQLAQDVWTLTTLGCCLFNTVFYCVCTILMMIRSVHQKQYV
jgi:hypothetical protein